VADKLLELDDKPRAVVDSSLIVYLRQYSSDIHLLYGRNVYGYIDGMLKPDDYAIYRQYSPDTYPKDLNGICEIMRSRKCTYFVTPYYWPISEDNMEAAGFEKKAKVDKYTIYKLKSK
jgi:hypothetical protein